MSSDYKALTDSISKNLAKLSKEQPETISSFQKLMQSATKTNALDTKTKELIALGIAIAVRCDGCIGFHVQKCVKLEVTKDEFMETLSMSVYMGGGPSLMYAAQAITAWEQFSGTEI